MEDDEKIKSFLANADDLRRQFEELEAEILKHFSQFPSPDEPDRAEEEAKPSK